MNALSSLNLNNNWSYRYASNPEEDYRVSIVDDTHWIPLSLLSDWSLVSSAQPGVDWFRRSVWLEPTDVCVSYVLVIDCVPESAYIYVNGQQVGQAEGNTRFEQDVTSLVALGENVITMKIVCATNESGGSFGTVQLRQVPCH